MERKARWNYIRSIKKKQIREIIDNTVITGNNILYFKLIVSN